LDNLLLKNALTLFFSEIMDKVKTEDKVGLIFRVRFYDNNIRSYSLLQRFDKKSQEDLYNVLEGFLEIKSEDYDDAAVKELIFSYFK
jgi:hypothetical protein